jgi:hypothetical protein
MASSDPTSGGDGDRDVFGSLPNARPQRPSARRDRSAAKAKPAAATGKAATKPRAEAKPAARTKAAARPGAAAGAKAAARPTAAARAKRAAARAKPASPRAAASQIPPAGYATPRADDDGALRGAELVTTAVQAAGELAQIGLAAGGRALKSALGRLPRP